MKHIKKQMQQYAEESVKTMEYRNMTITQSLLGKLTIIFTVLISFCLTINSCKKIEERDYAKEIEGEYSGIMTVFFNFEDSVKYEETIILTYLDFDTIRVSYTKKLTLNDDLIIDELDFSSDCFVTLKYDKSKDFIKNTKAKLRVFSEDPSFLIDDTKEFTVCGNVNKNRKAIFNFSNIEDPLPLTFIFRGDVIKN
jgi:hypothetical protein